MGMPSSQAANEAIVQQMAAARGWGTGPEWQALVDLVMNESGFNNLAQNPSSSAYGIFQFLDSTWAGYGGAKTSDPRLQTLYGLNYIQQRYGDPIRAWAFETSHTPNWYAAGGINDQNKPQLRDLFEPTVEAGKVRLGKGLADTKGLSDVFRGGFGDAGIAVKKFDTGGFLEPMSATLAINNTPFPESVTAPGQEVVKGSLRDIVINNPSAEPSEDSLQRTLSKLNFLGVLTG